MSNTLIKQWEDFWSSETENIKQWTYFWDSIIEKDTLLFEKTGNKPSIMKTSNKQTQRFVHGAEVLKNIQSIIKQVKAGTTQDKGVVYMMYYINDDNVRVPLYIGKSEFRGSKNRLSANAKSTSPTGPLLRWGARRDYHMGDLFEAYKGRKSTSKYKAWNKALFRNNGEFKRDVYLTMVSFDTLKVPTSPFPTSVAETESTLIIWAGQIFPNDLLNLDGKSRS